MQGSESLSQQWRSSRTPIDWQPCRLRNHPTARCGKLEVFENRAAGTGRKIALHIVVLPAHRRKPAADPVFLFTGGPGSGATEIAGVPDGGMLKSLRAQRDIVLVDQRGTGESNPLLCDLYGQDKQRYFEALFPLDRVRECRKQLEKKADLTLYTTSIAADDFDEVRAALGYEKMNLLGGSYGTTAALVYMRQHPERVRSAVLLGVSTPDFKLPLPFAKGAQQAMDGLFEACHREPNCQKAFPNLQTEFAEVLARLEKEPSRCQLVDPKTRTPEIVNIYRGPFTEQLRLLLYTAATARLIPFLLHRAYHNDFEPFAKVTLSNTKTLSKGLAMGMYFSVTCSEYASFISPSDVERETAGTFIGSYRVKAHLDACQQWPYRKAPDDFLAPVRSETPVLMISGGNDPATPPSFGAAMLKFLPNARQVMVRHGAHGFGGNCINNLITSFISTGTAQGLDASCTEQIRRPAFVTKLPKQYE